MTKKLIIHCCHHKTGTHVMKKILTDVCKHFKLKFQYCRQKKLRKDTDIWMEKHSNIDFNSIKRPIIGSHMIRNPCAIIISAYHYHKNTDEPWANEKNKELSDSSYRKVLNMLNENFGIHFEMKNTLYKESSKNTIMDIYNWNYNMPNFLETKFEDLMTNFNGTLTRIFKHYGFNQNMIEKALKIAANHNIQTKNHQFILKNKHITNKTFDREKWKKYFNNSELKKKFWVIYPPNLFSKIGYSNDLV